MYDSLLYVIPFFIYIGNTLIYIYGNKMPFCLFLCFSLQNILLLLRNCHYELIFYASTFFKHTSFSFIILPILSKTPPKIFSLYGCHKATKIITFKYFENVKFTILISACSIRFQFYYSLLFPQKRSKFKALKVQSVI